MTRAARFTQPDITRAVNAVRKAGLCVSGARIEPDGSIVVLIGEAIAANDGRNPVDKMLYG